MIIKIKIHRIHSKTKKTFISLNTRSLILIFRMEKNQQSRPVKKIRCQNIFKKVQQTGKLQRKNKQKMKKRKIQLKMKRIKIEIVARRMRKMIITRKTMIMKKTMIMRKTMITRKTMIMRKMMIMKTMQKSVSPAN